MIRPWYIYRCHSSSIANPATKSYHHTSRTNSNEILLESNWSKPTFTNWLCGSSHWCRAGYVRASLFIWKMFFIGNTYVYIHNALPIISHHMGTWNSPIIVRQTRLSFSMRNQYHGFSWSWRAKASATMLVVWCSVHSLPWTTEGFA